MAKLIYRYGAMNSAKSARLIMDAYSMRNDGKTVEIFKPVLDDRDGCYIKSRAVPTSLPAHVVKDEGYMFSTVMQNKPRIVLVDEVQFFTPEQVDELISIVDTLNTTVIAYGLLTDFMGEQFAGSKRLVEMADVVERVRSECTECNNEGIINARYVNGQIQLNGEQIVTGAEETYKVLCRKCYFEQTHGL